MVVEYLQYAAYQIPGSTMIKRGAIVACDRDLKLVKK